MGNSLGVGLRSEFGALLLQLLTQLAKILDDAVMHHREPVGGVRMGVGLSRFSVRRPAGMPNPARTRERLTRKPRLQLTQLALGAPTRELPVFQRRHAGGIIAAAFEPLERVGQRGGGRFSSENTNDSAHASGGS